MNKFIITGLIFLFFVQLTYGQHFLANLESENNILAINLSPANDDFIDLEFGQVEFFIRTTAESEVQIQDIQVDASNFPGNIPVALISDKIKGDYRIFHFGYAATPSVIRKSYFENSSYSFITITLRNVQVGELFELVSDPLTYKTYLNLTSAKGEDLALFEDETEDELTAESPFIGERKGKEENLFFQGTQIDFEQVSERPLLFATDNISVETFPNPVIDKVQVQINAEQAAKLKVSVQDINGQIIQTKMIEVNEGINQVQFNLKQLTSGTYFINAQSDTIKFSHKISVLH